MSKQSKLQEARAEANSLWLEIEGLSDEIAGLESKIDSLQSTRDLLAERLDHFTFRHTGMAAAISAMEEQARLDEMTPEELEAEAALKRQQKMLRARLGDNYQNKTAEVAQWWIA